MENNKNNKFFTYLLVVFLAAFVGSGIFLTVNNKKINSNAGQSAATTEIQENKITPILMSTRGFISLKNNSAVNKIESPLEISLEIDSDSENVTAFDSIIKYDPINFDFVKADSLDQDFKVYSYKKEGRLSLTVVKTGQGSTSIFKDNSVVKLVFQPKTKGEFVFSVIPSFEKETTKFVNEKTEVLYPKTNQLNITIN